MSLADPVALPEVCRVTAAERRHLPPSGLVNAMTVDVEDYFHAEALSECFPRDGWHSLERRVEANVDRLLARFADAGVTATFFILGWVAERHPQMVRRIAESGHEIASHGYGHHRVDRQRPVEFAEDVRRTKGLLEAIGGQAVTGYRAASFSIGRGDFWAFEVLAQAGYRYSSSIYPIRHDSYGMPEAPRFAFSPAPFQFTEIPVTTTVRFGANLPAGGGGYFRLLPYRLSRANMRRVNRRDRQPCVFYFHPWEIDPDQPRQGTISRRSRWRHYTNLSAMEGKLVRLLTDFTWGRMDRVFLTDCKS